MIRPFVVEPRHFDSGFVLKWDHCNLFLALFELFQFSRNGLVDNIYPIIPSRRGDAWICPPLVPSFVEIQLCHLFGIKPYLKCWLFITSLAANGKWLPPMVCSSVCLSVFLCISFCLVVCMSIGQSVCLFVWMHMFSVCLSDCCVSVIELLNLSIQ